jgi:hypothetical protein
MATTEKQPATVEQLQSRLVELQVQMVSLDTTPEQLATVQKEMMAVVDQIRGLKASRGKDLETIVASIKAHTFSIKEIFGDNAIEKFSDVELTQEAQKRGLFTAKVSTEEKGSDKPRKPAVPKVFASDSNPILLHIPKQADDHQRVVDVEIKQGRANEFYTGKAMFAPGNLPKPLLRCKGKDVKETKKNLENFVVAESKDYANKDAELTKIAEVVFAFVPKEKDKATAQA